MVAYCTCDQLQAPVQLPQRDTAPSPPHMSLDEIEIDDDNEFDFDEDMSICSDDQLEADLAQYA